MPTVNSTPDPEKKCIAGRYKIITVDGVKPGERISLLLHPTEHPQPEAATVAFSLRGYAGGSLLKGDVTYTPATQQLVGQVTPKQIKEDASVVLRDKLIAALAAGATATRAEEEREWEDDAGKKRVRKITTLTLSGSGVTFVFKRGGLIPHNASKGKKCKSCKSHDIRRENMPTLGEAKRRF